MDAIKHTIWWRRGRQAMSEVVTFRCDLEDLDVLRSHARRVGVDVSDLLRGSVKGLCLIEKNAQELVDRKSRPR